MLCHIHNVPHRLESLAVTVGCFPPGLWYTFPCAPRERKIFLISVRGSIAALHSFAKKSFIAQSRCPTRGRSLRPFCAPFPSAELSASSRLCVLLHGIVCLLSHNNWLLPARVSPNGRRGWCYAISSHGTNVPRGRHHIRCRTSPLCQARRMRLLTISIDPSTRKMATWVFRCVGALPPDLSRSHGCRTYNSLLRIHQGVPSHSYLEAVLTWIAIPCCGNLILVQIV